jgi:two-component system sensor histidine kinase/response regulator
LRKSGATPQHADRLDKIDAAGRHLLEIVDAVLDLSKIEAGHFVLVYSPLSVAETVADTVAMLQQRAQALRRRQALLNRAGTALKFSDAGSVTLWVRLQQDGPDRALLRFDGQDTGIGHCTRADRPLVLGV